MTLNASALAVAVLGFVVLFGGLGIALYYALEGGGYKSTAGEPTEDEAATGETGGYESTEDEAGASDE